MINDDLSVTNEVIGETRKERQIKIYNKLCETLNDNGHDCSIVLITSIPSREGDIKSEGTVLFNSQHLTAIKNTCQQIINYINTQQGQQL